MPQDSQNAACPLPSDEPSDRIALAHGEGAKAARRLIDELILPTVDKGRRPDWADAARLPRPDGDLAITTDSFVVSPLFFPGGDIGSLAVLGTVNDLAVSGARPLWISLALIIEEGLPRETLRRVLESVSRAATQVGVRVVTGDTKVVPRGAADGLFINTTGIGQLQSPAPPGPAALEVGDELLVTGPLGRHGMAVMACREGFQFDPPPTSDCAPLTDAVEALRNADVAVRAMRDATRGGLAAVLHEWADASGKTLTINEPDLPVTAEVRGACELLGLDAVHVANEGTMVVAVAAGCAAAAVAALRAVAVSRGTKCIGQVEPRGVAPVVIRRALGQELVLDEPVGAPLPRIC